MVEKIKKHISIFMSKFSFSKIAPFIAPIFVLANGFAMSYFRYAYGDETLYLLETGIIADCIRNFKWFGNEIVGTHGFIFKLPVALLFVLFGNSVFIATAFNVLIASASVYLCYKLFMLIIGSQKWSLAGSMMLATSYYFVLTVPTFLRDIPALFVLLLFLIAVLQKRPPWLVGIFLMFLLDAKEYLFFIVLPSYLSFYGISFIRSKNFSLTSVFINLKNLFAVLFPSILFLALMLTTPIIPLNGYVVYVMGLSPSGMATTFEGFISSIATHNFHRQGKNIVSLEDQQKKRKKKWFDDIAKESIEYKDEAAIKALKSLVDAIPENKKILLIYYKIKPELLEICPEERLITYFQSDIFPEKKFRKCSLSDKLKILDDLNIEGILVEPEMAGSVYFVSSQMPQLLQEEIFFEKVYDDQNSRIACFKRANPYERICVLAQKTLTDTDGKVLLIDDNENFGDYSPPQNIFSFFSVTFPLADFLKSKTKEDALELLEKLNIEKIILNRECVNRVNYTSSFLPVLLANKNIYDIEQSTSKFVVYAPPEKLKKEKLSEKDLASQDSKTGSGLLKDIQQHNRDLEHENNISKAVENIGSSILLDSKILVIDYNLPPEIMLGEEGKSVISYFNSEFPENAFRQIASPGRAFLFLIRNNIDAIIVVPEVARHFLYRASKLPEILKNEKYCIKVSPEDSSQLKIYLINDPFREIFSNAAKELKEDEKILVLDDKKDFKKYQIPQKVISYESDEFSLKDFYQVTDFIESYSYLKSRKIRRIIYNPQFEGVKLFNDSTLPVIFKKGDYSVKLSDINDYEVYDIRYALDDEVATLQNSDDKNKTLVIGRIEFMTRSNPKLFVDFYATNFPIERLKTNQNDLYATISILRSLGINYIAIDYQRINEKEFSKTALPTVLSDTYSEIIKDINEFSKIYRIKNEEEIASGIKKEFLELSIIDKIPSSSLNKGRNSILIFKEKLDPEMAFFAKGRRIYGFLFSEIPMMDFRSKSSIEVSDVLEKFNIGLILLFPEYTDNAFLKRCKIPLILTDPLFSEKVYEDEATKVSVYSLQNPYQSISQILQKENLNLDGFKILFIDDKNNNIYKFFSKQEKLFFFNDSFPAEDFAAIKDIKKAIDFLCDKNIKVILLNKHKDGQKLFKDTLFLSLLGYPNFCRTIFNTPNFSLHIVNEELFKKKEQEPTNASTKIADTIQKPEQIEKKYKLIIAGLPQKISEHRKGEIVHIDAGTPPENKIFDSWLVEPKTAVSAVKNIKMPQTEITMPEYDIKVQPIFKYPPKYDLIVYNGEGSGKYKEGEIVTIKAIPPETKEFDRWNADPGALLSSIHDLNSQETKVTMPPKKFRAIPIFRAKLFKLNVDNGTGSGVYPAGTTIKISAATPPSGMEFSHWTSTLTSANIISETNSPTSQITMPSSDIEVKAVFKEKPKPRSLKIISGNGGGSYAPRAKVQISPLNKGANWTFDKWSIKPENCITFSEILPDGTATFEMPETDIEIEAQYKKTPLLTQFANKLSKLNKYFAAYFGKICYPRTFSFLSVALVLVIPSFVMAIYLAGLWTKNSSPALFLVCYFFFFLLIYLFRASHGRYLLHLAPIIFLFFVMLIIKAFEGKKRLMLIAVIFSIPFVISSLFFEVTYLPIKIAGNSIFIAFLTILVLNLKNKWGGWLSKLSAMCLLSSYCIFTFGASIAAYYYIGQAGRYLKLGRNDEWDIIAKEIPKEGKVWLNVNPKMLSFYRGDISVDDRYKLSPLFPKATMLKRREKSYFNFNLPTREFEDAINKKQISILGIIVPDESTGYKYPNTNLLEKFMDSDWLWHEKTVNLKNKTLYIFRNIGK